MAWIESHQVIAKHPKTRRLARLLNESVPTVIGRLHLLWWWALDFAQDGDLSRYQPDEIADAAMWDDDAGTFVNALVESGWLEQTHMIHDWYEYAGRMIEKRAKNAERMKNARATHMQRTPHARAGATVPNSTLKDHVCSDDTLKLESRVSIQKTSTINMYSTEFEIFWSSYPKRIEKKSAYKAWNTRIRDGTDPQNMIVAAQNYAKSCLQNKTEPRFIKHPKTFLGPNEPFTEYIDTHHDEPEPQFTGRYIPRGLPLEVAAAMEEDERERRRVGSQTNRDG